MSKSKYLKTKDFPNDYTRDVLSIIDAMSIQGKDISVIGSMSLRSQLYAGDYDVDELIPSSMSVETMVKGIKEVIRDLMTMKNITIKVIKAGEIKERMVINPDAYVLNNKVVGIDPYKSLERLENLKKQGIISVSEYSDVKKLLKSNLTPEEFFELRGLAKFHTVKWKPSEVLQGFKVIGTGPKSFKFTLEEAVSQKGNIKIDVVGFVQNNKFNEFTMVYKFEKEKTQSVKTSIDTTLQGLKESVLEYYYDKNYYKMGKRIFAVAKYTDDTKTIEKLTEIFNSELGIVYQVYSDIETLLYLLENEDNLSMEKIKFETDQFKGRLANVYSLQKWFMEEKQIIGKINSIERLPDTQKGKSMYIGGLEFIRDRLFTILNEYAKSELEKIGLFPIPKKYKP
jgi:hypothetical protein